MPESMVIDEVLESPSAYKKNQSSRIAEIIDLNSVITKPWSKAKTSIQAALKSEDKLIQSWAIQTASAFGKEALELKEDMVKVSENYFFSQLKLSEFLVLGSVADKDAVSLFKKPLIKFLMMLSF